MRRLTNGVTLIELMVAISIFALLIGVAAPIVGDMSSNSRLREGGNALMSEALYAQTEALKRNGTVRLSVSGGSVQVIDITTPATPVTLRSRVFTKDIGADVMNIDFGSDGMTRPRGTDSSVDVSMSGVSCSAEKRCPRLRVEAGGAIRLCGNKLSCS